MAHVAAPPTAVHHVWLRTTSRTDKVQSTKQEISTIIFQKIGYLVLSTTVPYARYCKHTTVCGGSLFIFFPVLSFSNFTFLQVDRRLGGNGRFLSTKSTVVASERYHSWYSSLRAIISLVEKHFRQCKAVFAFWLNLLVDFIDLT